ncbi:MAG: HlyD family efflux transporter periplasmic adaptor subunit [Chloroflexota bacterium]
MRRLFFILGGLLFLVTVLTAGYFGYQSNQPNESTQIQKPITVSVTEGDVSQTVTAPGQLVGINEAMVGVDINGRIIELNVRPGSVVKAGDIMAQLDSQPYEDALLAAQLALSQATAVYNQSIAEASLAIEAGEAQVASVQAQYPSLTAAEISIQSAQEAEAFAAYEYQKAQDRHWEPPEVVEAYRQEWVAAQRAVTIAEANYRQLLNQQWAISQQADSLAKGVEQSAINAQFLADGGVDPQLALAVEAAEAALEKTVITAPFDGVVLDVFVRSGEQLFAGSNLLLLTDPNAGEVRTTIIEEDLSFVAIGQPVEIYFDARPDVVVNGFVSRVVPQRVVGEPRPLYHVYLTLNDPLPESVYPGMTADASLLIEKASGVLRLPRALVAARSDGTATVEVWRNGVISEQQISVGLRGDVFIVVLDGLSEGEEVVGE